MNSLTKQVAVADYYKTQLQDAEFLMNTPEFIVDSFAAGSPQLNKRIWWN
jgi:hypothetical protein